MYLLHLPEYGALKVGKTNDPVTRLRVHQSNFACDVIREWGPLTGHQASDVERELLTAWRAHDPPASLVGLPGWTETVSLDDVSIVEALKAIERLLHPPQSAFNPSLFSVRPCERSEAEELLEAHYTGTLPKGVKALFGLYEGEGLVGVAALGIPSYPGTSKSLYPENPGSVLDLRRFYVTHAVGPNAESWFLSRVLKQLPSDNEVVLAFADQTVGHHGAIYQATNFVYLGETAPSYHYESPNGDYVHKRVPWNRAKAAGNTEMGAANEAGLRRVADLPKYRYAYPRSRRARASLTARALPYPKPDVKMGPTPLEADPILPEALD